MTWLLKYEMCIAHCWHIMLKIDCRSKHMQADTHKLLAHWNWEQGAQQQLLPFLVEAALGNNESHSCFQLFHNSTIRLVLPLDAGGWECVQSILLMNKENVCLTLFLVFRLKSHACPWIWFKMFRPWRIYVCICSQRYISMTLYCNKLQGIATFVLTKCHS